MRISGKSIRPVVFALVFITALGAECPVTQDAFPGAGPETPSSRIITLELLNQSGVTAFVTATFRVGEEIVRTTTRHMPPAGAGATEVVVPTTTTTLHVRAVEADVLPNARLRKPPPAERPGDLLTDRTLAIPAETPDGETIRIIVHPYGFIDCNYNDIEDPTDLANGTSHDCNHNGIPDECDLTSGTSQDCDTDSIPDECEIAVDPALDCNHNGILDSCDLADGTSQDCNLNNTPDECEPEVSMVVLVVEHEPAYNRILASDHLGTTPSVLADFTMASLGLVRDMAPHPLPGGLVPLTMTGVSVGDASVQRVALASGAVTQLVAGQDEIGGIAFDEATSAMYWGAWIGAPSTSDGIRKASLAGTGVTTVTAGLPSGVTRIAVHTPTERIYFLTVDTGTDIRRMNPDGSNIEVVHSGLSNLRSLDIWPQRNLLAWTRHEAGGGVYVSSIDGGPVSQIAVEPTVMGVAFDRENCRIYWSAEGDGTTNAAFLDRANLDGSGHQRVLGNLNQPIDISVFPDGS